MKDRNMGVETDIDLQQFLDELEIIKSEIEMVKSEDVESENEENSVYASIEELEKNIEELNRFFSFQYQMILIAEEGKRVTNWGRLGSFKVVRLKIGKRIETIPFHFTVRPSTEHGQGNMGHFRFSKEMIIEKIISHFKTKRDEY